MISVDWKTLATGPNFFQAAYNSLPVGYHAGKLISQIVTETGALLADFHVVGFSLGGQMVAGIGKALEGKLNRITALDPAGERKLSSWLFVAWLINLDNTIKARMS